MKQWPYHFQSSMSNVLVIVAALMAIFLVIYGLYRILRNPFHYPYFVRSFDVSRKRNVDIEDYIDKYLCSEFGWNCIVEHHKLEEKNGELHSNLYIEKEAYSPAL